LRRDSLNYKYTGGIGGRSQEKLAEQADMSLQYLALLELARKFPSGEMLERFAANIERVVAETIEKKISGE
jgi:transcriptional regulator with XRE-family HTH domain